MPYIIHLSPQIPPKPEKIAHIGPACLYEPHFFNLLRVANRPLFFH